MSDRFDDAVVGAGIIGLAHAYHLAKRGRKVIVFERSAKAMGASVRNFGMLWPIGQPAGPMRTMALRSLEIWREILAVSGLWHSPCGSLHLAYRDDEWRVLQEFVAGASKDGYAVSLLNPTEVRKRSPHVRQENLHGGMFSAAETCVDPRQIIAELPGWLNKTLGVEFCFNHLLTGHGAPGLHGANRLWVCSGEDLQTLYPDVMQSWGLRRCKLQMMRTEPMGIDWKLGPMLAAGLTLRHYRSFESCPSLPALRKRFAEENPEFDRFGIHVMASQNGLGEIIIGDSHEYGLENAEPFNKDEIDRMILDYLRGFLDVPDLRIAGRWYGIYVKHATEYYLTASPEPNVVLINGVGGNGMTLSFGLAEQVVNEVLA